MSDYTLTVLSLGAGVQSSAMLVCSALGGLHGVPRADCAIFADTGDEPQAVYDYLEILTKWVEPYGIPVHIVRNGYHSEQSLSVSILRSIESTGSRFASLPMFTADEDGAGVGMGVRRQCTKEWKIEPIHNKIRTLIGLKKGQRCPPDVRVRSLIGISVDEAQRMKPSFHKWVDNSYPLVDARLRRGDCSRIAIEAGLPKPTKSSCVMCPYHSKKTWVLMKREQPEEFAMAVSFDKATRVQGRIEKKCYLHRYCIPLDEAVAVDERQMDLFGELPDEPDHFGNECEGLCGV